MLRGVQQRWQGSLALLFCRSLLRRRSLTASRPTAWMGSYLCMTWAEEPSMHRSFGQWRAGSELSTMREIISSAEKILMRGFWIIWSESYSEKLASEHSSQAPTERHSPSLSQRLKTEKFNLRIVQARTYQLRIWGGDWRTLKRASS